jgi:DNA-binding MarR family transcriptional regulator
MKITSIRCPDLPLSRRIAMILKQYHGQLRKNIQHPIAGKYYPLLLRLDTKAGQVTQQDLVEYLGIDKTSMVRIIDELVQANLISRAPNPADRRFHQIHLTDQGKALMPEIRGAINNVNNLMMNGLSDAESDQFILSLQHIQDNLNQLDQSATNDCVPAQSKDI